MRQGIPAMVAQIRSFSDPAGYGARLLTFAQFDPAQGAIGGVRLETSAEVTGNLWVENLEGRDIALTDTPRAHVTVFSPNGDRLDELSVQGEETITLAGFDGIVDYAGESGINLTVTGSVDGISGTDPGGTIDTAPFIGTGTVALPVSDFATNRIAGPANMRVRTEASVGASVRLTYDYTPAPGVIDNDDDDNIVINAEPPLPFDRPAAVTSAPQVFRYDPTATGWLEAVTVDRFNPLLGPLSAVNIRVLTTIQISASVENHGTAPGSAEIAQHAVTELQLNGFTLTSSTADARRTLAFGAADGVDDFAGAGGIANPGAPVIKAQALSLASADYRAVFTDDGTLDLFLFSDGSGEINGPASFLAEIAALSGAVIEVAYTYLVGPDASAVLVEVDNAGVSSRIAAQPYAGQVANLRHQYINITPENLAVSATTDNWFIRTGDGTDAITARGGTNVIDGGGGSNLLTGDFGRDTFFVDVRNPAIDVWSTVANFQPGDEVTLWGLTPDNAQFAWVDNQGAAGATGLTLHATSPSRPSGSLTLTGYTTDDLTNGRLTTSFGTIGGNDYLFVRAT